MNNERWAACTIASANYLDFVMTSYTSFSRYHPGQRYFVLIVDEPEQVAQRDYPFEVVYAKDLPLRDFYGVAFRFDVLELNTNVKPTFLKHLLQHGDIDKVLYFDPDIFFYRPLDEVVALLENNAIVLTPHCMTPIQDSLKPAEQDFLRTGVFNLGFIGLRFSEEACRMLDWWEERCLTRGYHEIPSGLFVDQKWINLVPCFFSSVHILKHPGCNMAYWNLHERTLVKNSLGQWIVNDQYPLVFFHFSGIVPDSETVLSKYQNRFQLSQRPDLAELFLQYRLELKKNRQQYENLKLVYSYGCFSNGKPIPLLTRRIFGRLHEKFGPVNPFDATGPFYKWASERGLAGTEESSKNYTALTYDKNDFRLRLIHKILYILLRAVGINRYMLLMKYLSFISVLGNQAVLFNADDFQSRQGK